MTISSNDQPLHAVRWEAWRIDPSSSTFELRVNHELGPARVVAAFRRVDGVLQRSPTGDIRIAFAIDTASLQLIGKQDDPRSRSLRSFLSRQASPLVLFESTRVTDDGESRLRVTGHLVTGARSMPLELSVEITSVGSTLEIRAVAAADHRRLGVTWIPGGPLKAPSELVVRATLTRVRTIEGGIGHNFPEEALEAFADAVPEVGAVR